MAASLPQQNQSRRLAGWARLHWRRYALLSPTLAVVTLVMILPLSMLVLASFWTQDYLTLHRDFSLANYEQMLSDPLIRRLFAKSVAISALVTFITVALAYPMAYFVAFDVTGSKTAWLILLTVPLWTSYLLRVFAWKIILGFNGVINSGLLFLGWARNPLEALLYNPIAVTITLAHAWAAFAVLPIYVSLEKIDRSLLEAAADLGDGPVRRFRRILLPLSLPGVIAASVLIFVPTLGDYVTPQLVGGTSGAMIGNFIQAQFGDANNWPLGATICLGLMALATVLALAFVGAAAALSRAQR